MGFVHGVYLDLLSLGLLPVSAQLDLLQCLSLELEDSVRTISETWRLVEVVRDTCAFLQYRWLSQHFWRHSSPFSIKT